MESDSDRSRGNGCLYAAGGLGVLLVVAGVGLELLGDVDLSAPDVEPEAEQHRGFDPNRAVGPDEGAAATPAPAPVQPPAPEPVPPPEPEETERLLWHAEVESGPMESGTPCVLAVDVARRLAGPAPVHVSLECGERELYDAPASGTLEETPEAPGRYAYRAVIDSAVTGNALEVRSGRHRATLRGFDGVTSLFVEDLSLPRRGEPFLTANAGRAAQVTHRLRLLAVPTQTGGDVPVALAEARGAGRPRLGGGGPSCELSGGTTLSSGYNCRVLLRCGKELVYGAGTTGYNDCTVRDGRIVSAADTGTTLENSDPRFVLDLDRGTLDVSDDDGVSSWTAVFELREDPRCTLTGQWDGAALDAEDASFTWTMSGAGGEPPWTATIAWSGATFDGLRETVSATADCQAGRIEMTTQSVSDPQLGEGTYTVWLGPSFRALAGDWRGEQAVPGVLWGTRR